jgi:hypothetical protein
MSFSLKEAAAPKIDASPRKSIHGRAFHMPGYVGRVTAYI